MSMLFSFPLDPDASTLEIISDTIYANSTTAKRKADAAARSKGSGDTGKAPPNKPVSIADVVKAVPKSTQPEWGFKVVNKKKKGGRS
jgi:PERQ amino acid-rich with GYF domain-containing protein